MPAFLTPLLLRWIVVLGVAASLFGYGYIKGNAHGTAKLDRYKGEQAIATTKLIAAREKIVTQVQTKYVDRIQKIVTKGDEIVKEVQVYVQKVDDAGCVVPVGFVREFNAAWSGTPAGSPQETDRRPSGYPLSAVASTDASNAETCLIWKEQRDGVIEFYRKLQATK